jgi:hypothetical protein
MIFLYDSPRGGGPEQQASLHSIDISTWGRVSDAEASFTDSSSTLFTLYMSHAEKTDQKQTDSWKAGADGILVFISGQPVVVCVVNALKSTVVDRTICYRCRHVRGRQL